MASLFDPAHTCMAPVAHGYRHGNGCAGIVGCMQVCLHEGRSLPAALPIRMHGACMWSHASYAQIQMPFTRLATRTRALQLVRGPTQMGNCIICRWDLKFCSTCAGHAGPLLIISLLNLRLPRIKAIDQGPAVWTKTINSMHAPGSLSSSFDMCIRTLQLPWGGCSLPAPCLQHA